MKGRKLDIAIVGGGLAGGLIALALHRARPDLAVQLLEGSGSPGGNRRWNWFASDLSSQGAALLAPFRKAEWDAGYDVRFPGLSRHLATPCRSLSSADFAAALARELPEGAIRPRAAAAMLDARSVTLESGETIGARAVIDCRGIAHPAGLTGGWQVFMGRRIRTPAPHGVEHPVIMDVRGGEPEASGFVTVLPLGAHGLFIKDTCYTNSPSPDRPALSRRIDAYCREQGWDGEILGHETGALPVVTGGDLAAFQAAHRVDGVAVAGMRGGFFHPLTGNSLPMAVETALAIAEDADLPGSQLAALMDARARRHWQAARFYRRMARMLFDAGDCRVFERFHRLPEPLIERFHAGRSTRLDRLRVLCGRPLAGRRAPVERSAAA
ncbi:MAG: lycopene beta-cyclase CrtY [Novosphingobium sp.]|nr:lycopene beta-cyclase CrtY [Novosphingobium sp.]